MSFLLDTNVLSEVRRPEPDRQVLRWLHEVDEDRTFISVISLAEIRKGVQLLPEGVRREALAAWLADDLPNRFSGRILPVDAPIELATAFRFGQMTVIDDIAGRVATVRTTTF